ncbi:DUF1294 domain-containing protein [Clostridium sp. 1001271B_151109_B4]|uniref:DUF1294 domain-containing protein n=1 Tax=Clostridium sp. 1001271B_151109_B4 TaxID=2787148 RepID=UPI0018AA6688|nr:DUF1294 domain-containing protein [Clostridium sp. 1001271B_151109_B4]
MTLKFIYLLLVNLLLFILMGIDKRKAITNKWRIKEKTLLILCLLGGSMGGIIGMYTFRHKTKHLKFKIGFPVIFVIQLIVVLYTIK